MKKEKKPLSYFFGKWPGGIEEVNEMEKDIEKSRKRIKMRDINFGNQNRKRKITKVG